MGYEGKDEPTETVGKQVEIDKGGVEELVSKDINATRNEYLFSTPAVITRWLHNAVNDPRDLPIAFLFFNVTLITLPAAAAVFYIADWRVGLLYFVTNLLTFQERFILGLHYSSHLPLFKPKYALLNQWAPLVLCPFFGLPSGMYYLHHCVMHHKENNVFPWDVSTTEPYQRDNPLHFICYWLRFLVAIWVELPYYAAKRGRYKMCAQGVSTILGYFGCLKLLYSVYPVGTTWTLIVPLTAGSFVLMLGNWSQHVFVSPTLHQMDMKRRHVNYHLTYNIVDAPFNQKTFNDGYHIEHHIHSRRHWSEMPAHSLAAINEYANEDAIVFKNLDFIAVGVLIFCRAYKILARNFVDVRSTKRSDAEIEALLRSRLVPIIRC